jgi:hypothetical protein
MRDHIYRVSPHIYIVIGILLLFQLVNLNSDFFPIRSHVSNEVIPCPPIPIDSLSVYPIYLLSTPRENKITANLIQLNYEVLETLKL